MFDTMTVTKVGGALAGALLIFLLLNWASEIIYSTDTEGSKHEEAPKAAYVIEVEEESAGDEAAGEEMVDVAALVAAGDPEKGAKVFAKCKACHKLKKGENATGPSLFGIVGKDIAAAAGYGYSGALSGMDGTWTVEALFDFLTKPSAFAPGTKMSFAGLKKEKDKANLIAYLKTVGG